MIFHVGRQLGLECRNAYAHLVLKPLLDFVNNLSDTLLCIDPKAVAKFRQVFQGALLSLVLLEFHQPCIYKVSTGLLIDKLFLDLQ